MSQPLPVAYEYDISAFVRPVSKLSVYGAENLDIYKASYKGHLVAATVIRVLGPLADRKPWDRTEKRFLREIVHWRKLRHENVTPFYGFCKSNFGPPGAISYISPWMRGGRATDYLKVHPDADRMNLVVGIANGLAYLHDNELVHGELMGSNILVEHSRGRAMLCDYGLWNILDDNRFEFTMGDRESLRFLAYELCTCSVLQPTFATDVWSFGMTAYQLFSGKLPYDHVYSSCRVPRHVADGQLPSHPGSPAQERGLTDDMWDLMQRCWITDHDIRPSSKSVVESIQKVRDQWYDPPAATVTP